MTQTASLLAAAAPARGLTIAVFIAVLALALGITLWAARRIQSATDFWSAGPLVGRLGSRHVGGDGSLVVGTHPGGSGATGCQGR